VIDLIFPPRCIYCSEKTKKSKHFLCPSCIELLQLSDVPRLIGHRSNYFVKAFDRRGPAFAIHTHFRHYKAYGMKDAMAAYMVAQLARLECALPDLIIPMPATWWEYYKMGFHPNLVLAQGMAKLSSLSYSDCLRIKLNGEVVWKITDSIQQKRVVLIADSFQDKKRFQRTLRTLKEGFALEINVLAFC
jgi:predicted amidophosphoribosyltransferase